MKQRRYAQATKKMMAEIRRNVKNIFRTCTAWSVDITKAKHDACTTQNATL